MGINLRAVAARAITQVLHGHSLDASLPAALSTLADARDQAWVQAVCYGVCRQYPRLMVLLSFLLTRPLKTKDHDILALLLVGLFQLTDMRTPVHAAVAETVQATRQHKKSWAKNLVNAVLRQFIKQQAELEKKALDYPDAQYSHPLWWIDAVKKAWPSTWQEILLANNAHPPFALRVNQRRLSRQAYLDKLTQAELHAAIIPEAEQGIVLDTPLAAEKLPGFHAGEIYIQDGAAQLAASLLDLAPGQCVLDACAAPGGKLAHILETEPQLARCLAIEKEAGRTLLIQENLKRLHLQAECLQADAAAVTAWWDGCLFDRILLDAPCSASGVIRRHPDIKLLRKKEDVAHLARIQLELLQALWPLLKPGGLLLYATCSFLPQENSDVIHTFLTQQPDAQEKKITACWGVATPYGRQILPGMHDMDGFYYARLEKL